ncbi:hypothetical protein MTR67_007207 [Solanum verrucosum]|uniref:Replication factor A C-terminal domain-containing protein n=1 Tax=Solanum verrucosum TaxID=315347 RepID=A0AAF0TAD5_SOLVR|nr:hypothetical protein MTR67_007207 [Solanum verrucosum]
MNEEVVPIANIDSQQDVSTTFSLYFSSKSTIIILILICLLAQGQTFTIEAKITFPTDLKKFYMLVCSNCGQDVHYPTIREIHCMNCDQKNLLVPRCRFDVDLKDNSGSIIGIIMDKEGEKLCYF